MCVSGIWTNQPQVLHTKLPNNMHFSLLPLVSLFSLVSSVAIPQSILPTGQTVKQDIINIHNAVLELDATVQAYDGSPFPTSLVDGTPVLLGVAKIHTVNRAGFRHALAALPFTVADSNDVITTVTDTGECLLVTLEDVSRTNDFSQQEYSGFDEASEGETAGF